MQERTLGSSEVGHAGTRWLWGVALLGLGALVGALVTRSAAPAKPAEPANGIAAASPAVPPGVTTANISTEVQRKMLALMAQPQPQSDGAAKPSDDPHVNEPTTAELLDTVWLQPRDETWASATQPVLEQDLAKLGAQLRFRVGKVDCRTSRCIAELEWPNGAAAQRDFKAVMSSDAQRVDCHRRLLLPPADSPSGHAQLIVNCDQQQKRTKTP